MTGDIPPGMHWDDIRGWHQPDKNEEPVFLTSMEPVNAGWIAVSNKQPPKGETFIGFCGDGKFLCEWYERYQAFIDSGSGDPFGESREARNDQKLPWFELTHWMPLPPDP